MGMPFLVPRVPIAKRRKWLVEQLLQGKKELDPIAGTAEAGGLTACEN